MTIKEIIKSFEGKNKKQIIEIIKRYKKMKKEEYLRWTFINNRPAVYGDLHSLFVLSKQNKIKLHLTSRQGILEYTYSKI